MAPAPTAKERIEVTAPPTILTINMLSACFSTETQYGLYGTRSQTVVIVWPDGSAEAVERYRDDGAGGGQAGVWGEARLEFKVEL